MKNNKLTFALAALGIISLASVAEANQVVYLTGSTAARALIFNALTTPGIVFDSGSTITKFPSTASSSTSVVNFEGPIGGVTYDIDCSWTGSEAGIASVCGQTISQNVNGGPHNLPGSPASFLQPPAFTTQATVSQADLSMADTSQAVSLTSPVQFPAHDYGRVGIVTFTAMKSYEATPDSGWTDLKNITTSDMNNAIVAPAPESFFTGNSADTDFVVVCGRNEGSGTRANALLNFQYPIFGTVDQYAYAYYPASTPGILTFGNSTATNFVAGQTLNEVFNDGFDSGGGVGSSLQVDATGANVGGTPVVIVGYLGISDALKANTVNGNGSGAGAATYLPFNGVYEGDQNVINGSYTYWGQEHLYGQPGQSSTGPAATVANKLVPGIATVMAATGGSITDTTKAAGACTGDVSTTPKQSILIPVAMMQANRGTDGGFPAPGPF